MFSRAKTGQTLMNRNNALIDRVIILIYQDRLFRKSPELSGMDPIFFGTCFV
jgi:hypothetical protein